jgi:hypothetical protein
VNPEDGDGGARGVFMDPNKTVTAGPPADSEYWGRHGRDCLLYCRHPWPGRRKFKCPSCDGKAWVGDGSDLYRPTLLGVFLGYILRVARDAGWVFRREPEARMCSSCRQRALERTREVA